MSYLDYVIPIKGMDDFVVENGQGMYLYDISNKQYLDLNGGQFCAIFGHNNKDYQDLIKSYDNGLMHTNTTVISTSVIEACQAINQLAPELKPASIILSTGTEALLFVQRLSKLTTKKEIIATNDLSFLALTYSTNQDSIQTISTPRSTDQIQDSLDQFEALASKEEVAAFICEPIISMGGGIFLDATYLQELRNICYKHNILFIFDESQIGFGRTGSWFYFQQLGFVPDMVISAKALGNGLPIALVSINRELLDYNNPITSYATHQNPPFAGAVIQAGIQYIKDNNLLQSNIQLGKYLLGSLAQLSLSNPIFQNARGKGLFNVVDIVSDDLTTGDRLYQYALKKGIVLSITPDKKAIRFVTPYILTHQQIDQVIQVLKDFK